MTYRIATYLTEMRSNSGTLLDITDQTRARTGDPPHNYDSLAGLLTVTCYMTVCRPLVQCQGPVFGPETVLKE